MFQQVCFDTEKSVSLTKQRTKTWQFDKYSKNTWENLVPFFTIDIGIKGNNIKREIWKKPTANLILDDEKLKDSLRWETKLIKN